jgi:HEAT repeat protein
MEELAVDGAAVPVARLSALSNIYGEDQKEFEAGWAKLGPAARSHLVDTLFELAEDDVQQNFEGIFMKLLEDDGAQIRLRAVEGLWESQDSRLIDRFIDLLRSDPDDEVRAAAASSLGRFELAAELDDRKTAAAKRMDNALLAAFNDPKSTPLIRRRALEAISPRSLPEVDTMIRAALDADVRDLQIGAIYAMGQTCEPGWIPTLIEELQDDDNELRFEAANALGELEEEDAVPALIKRLDDPDKEVRLAVINALGMIGGNAARNVLRRVAQFDDETMAEAAQEALGVADFNDNPLHAGY